MDSTDPLLEGGRTSIFALFYHLLFFSRLKAVLVKFDSS